MTMTKAGISPGLFLCVGLIADVRLGCRRKEPGAGHAFLFRSPVDEPEHAGREGHIHAHGLFRLGVDGDELVQGAFRDVDFKLAAVRFGLGLGRSQTGRGRRGVPRSASTSSQPVAASCAASKASCSVSPKVLQPSRSGKNTQNVPSSCGKNCAM